MTVVEPATPQATARVLVDASASRQSVLVAGGRTKLVWGRTARPADLLLSTRGLARLVAHAAGDLTATVEAGMTLAALNEQLARHGQWLPLESSFDETTVGGALATNDSGPLRQRFGTPRDLLIGITLATTGGQVVKAGGKVVKNVAGYDLGKLVTGSFGSLAVIVDATFKLSPRPAAFATRRFRFVESRAAAAATLALAHGPLDLFALDLHRSNLTTDVLVRFGSPSAAAAEEQAACAETLAPGADVTRYSGADEESYWRQHRRRPWAGEAAVLSLSWLPAQLADVLALVDELRDGGAAVEFVARAGVGSGLLRTEATGPAVVALTTSLRARRDLFQHVAVLRADDATRGAIDVWPDAGARGPLLAAVKRAFDPGDILNAGRGPI